MTADVLDGSAFRFWCTMGGVAMALAVALGAFGAHALRGRLDADGERRWNTAVSWHVPHALALFLVGLLDQSTSLALFGRFAALELAANEEATSWSNAAGWCFLAGIALFSGSLYAMALNGKRWLGAVTPLGGLAWIAGWVLLAVAVRTS